MIDKQEVIKNILDQLDDKDSVLSSADLSSLYTVLDDALQNYKIEMKEKISNTLATNEEMINRFVDAKLIEGKSEKTLYNYRNEIYKLMSYLNKPYNEITAEDIRRFMSYRKTSNKLKSVSIQNIRQYLKSFFKWLAREEYITKNPMDKIDVIKVEQKVIDTLSDEEAEIIRCACNNERDLAIIDLLSGSGMRVSELCALNKEDVNFTTKEIIVFGKGSKERVCFMTGKAKVHLQWYLDSRNR